MHLSPCQITNTARPLYNLPLTLHLLQQYRLLQKQTVVVDEPSILNMLPTYKHMSNPYPHLPFFRSFLTTHTKAKKAVIRLAPKWLIQVALALASLPPPASSQPTLPLATPHPSAPVPSPTRAPPEWGLVACGEEERRRVGAAKDEGDGLKGDGGKHSLPEANEANAVHELTSEDREAELDSVAVAELGVGVASRWRLGVWMR